MEDIEAYNRHIAERGYSASQVAKRIQLVKAIIGRDGRPEHGRQVLTWNWDSRDVVHGLPPRERILPTVKQLKRLLGASDLRGKTMIWLGIGLGLGAKDLAAVAESERGRKLLAELRTVPPDLLGDSWTQLLQRFATQLEPKDRAVTPTNLP
jgi:hypothetical protein